MVTVSAGDKVKLDSLIVQLHVVQKGPGDSQEESRERRPASRGETRRQDAEGTGVTSPGVNQPGR